MRMTLKRIASNKDGTFGVLIYEGIPFAVTCEREWLDNKTGVSCIPNGVYVCKRVMSPKFGDTFEITGVQDRSHVLFHWGNTQGDSKGCILVAEKFGTLKGHTAVLESRAPGEGINEFLSLTKGVYEFSLDIHSV